jgi:hypothetical protein
VNLRLPKKGRRWNLTESFISLSKTYIIYGVSYPEFIKLINLKRNPTLKIRGPKP